MKLSELFVYLRMIVYFHRNPITYEIFYVGIASEKTRYKRHFQKTNRNKYWHHTVKKYGGFIVQVVCEKLSDEAAKEKERFYISLLGKKINGGQLVNLADGGETNSGYKFTEDHKGKISNAAKKRGNEWLNTPEIRAKAAKTFSDRYTGKFKGKENPNFGNRWTDEMKKSMSEKKKLYFSKIPSRRKVYQKLPEDVRKKIVYESMVNRWGKKVVCLKTGKVYKTIVEAAASIGMKSDTLRHKLNGKNPNETFLRFLTKSCSPV